MIKFCPLCKNNLAIENFPIESRSKDNYYYICKTCKNKKAVVNYAKNVLKFRELGKIYYQNNKEFEKQRHKLKYQKQKTNAKFMARKKDTLSKWRKANPEFLLANNAKRRANKENNGSYLVTAKDIKKIKSYPCFYCASKDNIQLEHVMPISRGGRHSIGNLKAACQNCNLQKSNKTIMEWRMYKIGN